VTAGFLGNPVATAAIRSIIAGRSSRGPFPFHCTPQGHTDRCSIAMQASRSDSPSELLEELLETIARTLVDHPEEVRVRAVQGQAVTVLELRVHPEDIGHVVGQNGRIAEAIRTILRAVRRKLKQYVKVEILD
jgi:uncharacterized protein